MKIGIRKEENGSVYLDLTSLKTGRFTEETLSAPPYNFKIVEVPEEYVNEISVDDFGNDLEFDLNKYNARKTSEAALKEIDDIKANLVRWKEDVEQRELFGMERLDCDEKKQMCAQSIVRLRELEKLVINSLVDEEGWL